MNADTSKHLNGYFAIDGNGTVYFNNNNNNNGILYSFTKDLQLNWTDDIKGISHGGAALSKHGLLAIAGADNFLRVYKPVNLKVYQISIDHKMPEASHLVYPHFISFKYYVQYNTKVKLLIYNMRGQEVYGKVNIGNTPGFHVVKVNNFFVSGQYIYQFSIGNKTVSKKLHIAR